MGESAKVIKTKQNISADIRIALGYWSRKTSEKRKVKQKFFVAVEFSPVSS